MDEILNCLIEEVNRCRGLAKIPGIETFKDEYLHKAELLEQAAEIVKDTAGIGPHGRLIDADAFLELCTDYAVTPSDYEFRKRLEYALTKVPTVIPANKEATGNV